jgi:hypothetical protein
MPVSDPERYQAYGRGYIIRTSLSDLESRSTFQTTSTSPWPKPVEQSMKLGPVPTAARSLFPKDLIAMGGFQRGYLRSDILIVRRYVRISRNALHNPIANRFRSAIQFCNAANRANGRSGNSLRKPPPYFKITALSSDRARRAALGETKRRLTSTESAEDRKIPYIKVKGADKYLYQAVDSTRADDRFPATSAKRYLTFFFLASDFFGIMASQ